MVKIYNMKLTDFKIGDIVELKSGGPKMTVSVINDEENTIGCTWFKDQTSHPTTHSFNPELIKKISKRSAIDFLPG